MKYKAVIGLEMHCEMKSNMKVFSYSKNEYSLIPNINVDLVDMAFPGTLPILNKECVKKAILAALAFNCKVPKYLYFDRKNYYYPDLPKGYQITQMHEPIGTGGSVLIDADGETKEIKIHDIHLEEDSASMDHFSDVSLINYNRAGVPLLELVTEPCISSAKEAVTFLEEVRRIYQYAGISDADTKKGQIRCDVNVSIMDYDSNVLGTKVEVKNVNSFSNVYDTIIYEIDRQTKLKEMGRYDEVVQETRRFDEDSKTTISMRSKVDAIDYKYFVEPNIPKLKIEDSLVEEIRKNLPELPLIRKLRYINIYGLSLYDAGIIIKDKAYADYFEECVNLGADPKLAANYLIVNIIAYLNKELITLSEFYLTPKYLVEILTELKKGTISSKQAKEIFIKSLNELKEPITYINENSQISNKEKLEEIISNIINNNKKQVEEYKNGKTNLFDYFVGQVMRETRGKANPSLTKDILKDKLDN